MAQVVNVLVCYFQFVLICLINEHILRLMAGDNHSFMVSVYVPPNKVFGRVESLLPMLQVGVAVLMVLVQLVEVGFVNLSSAVSGWCLNP